MKKAISVLLSVILVLSLNITALAGNYGQEGDSDAAIENLPDDGAEAEDSYADGEEEQGEAPLQDSDSVSPQDDIPLLESENHIAYVSGYDGGSWFYPDRSITRAEAAQIFYNLLKEKPEHDVTFTDVSRDDWCYDAVSALSALEIIKGYPSGAFKPDSTISRAEFITIAARFTGMQEGSANFSDVGENHWAYMSISTGCARGWINGYSDGSFHPDSGITRAEVVTVINRMLGRQADENVATIRDTRRFADVPGKHWAFAEICEAATAHEYNFSDGYEKWITAPEPDGSGWYETDGEYYYSNPSGDGVLTGFNYIEGYTYYFDESTGALRSGWQVIDGDYYLLPDINTKDSALNVRDILTEVNYYDMYRGGSDIDYIVIHYTGVPGDNAVSEANYFKSTYRGTSAGYFVDETAIVRCVLDEDVAWHCANDVYFHDECRNMNSIGIEMTSEKRKVNSGGSLSAYDSDWYFTSGTLENTAALVRELMMRYGVPVENVIRHYDISHKICPAPMVNDFSQWQDFLKLVTRGEIDYNGQYMAFTTEALTVYSGPGASYPSVGSLRQWESVKVYDEKGKDCTREGRWVQIGSGWVMYQYICRVGV